VSDCDEGDREGDNAYSGALTKARVLEMVRAAPKDGKGVAKQSIVRTLAASEDAVTDALMGLRRDQLVQFRRGGWYPREQKMLVPELGLVDSQRNRRWFAICQYLGSLGYEQEKAQLRAWEIVALWEGTK
jgi:hypothetical protein